MNLNEALNICEQVQNRYQAFAKIAEVLTLARQQESLVNQRNAELEKVNASLKAGREEVQALDARVTAARVTAIQAEKDAAAEVKKFQADNDKAIERIRALGAEQIAKLEAELKDREEAFKAAMLDMADQEAKRRGEMASLEKQVEALKETARKVLA